MADQLRAAQAEVERLAAELAESREMSLRWRTALQSCADSLGLNVGDSLSLHVPNGVARLTAENEALVAAARSVVDADTHVTPGKSRFEATTEAIARLEKLLPMQQAAAAKETP